MRYLESKPKLIALGLLLIMQTNLNYGKCQASLNSHDDTICYSIDQAKEMIYYAYKGKFCDTLINNYEKQAKDYIQVIQAKDEQLTLSEQLINKLRNEIKKTHREKKLWMGLTCVSTLGLLFMIIF